MDSKTHRYRLCPIGYAYWQDPHRELVTGVVDFGDWKRTYNLRDRWPA